MSSQTTEKWEKEFDEYFENLRWDGRKGTMNIKDFISQSIQAAVEEERKKIAEEVEMIKLPIPNPYGKWVKVERVNMIIDKVISIIIKHQ